VTSHFHAVVWIDHREAKVLHFNADSSDTALVRPHNPARQVHHKANSIGSGHAAEDHDYFHRTAQALLGAQAILITGPANAKTEFAKHIQQHEPGINSFVAGVETLDHPTDGELLAFARRYFQVHDRMLSQPPHTSH
jgi:stalled ribosome rescue protein Dom34